MVKIFERKINVDVTLWWLIDTYFEKYWKWLLSGLGALLAAWWAWRRENPKRKAGAESA